MVKPVVETKSLTKRYDGFTAVDSLDLSVKKGEVYGLLGPNGSGKTSIILMLLGLTEPTEGEVRVLDLDPARQPLSVKARVGYLPAEVGFYSNLTARENLIYIGLGILGLGIPPTGEEVVRMILYLLVTIFYGEVWLALALVFSVVFRQPATAALASLSVWLFFTVFWNILADLLANAVRPVQIGLPQEILLQTELANALARISPNTLYVEATVGLLNPGTRSFRMILPSQLQEMILGAPLPLGESTLLIWPHLTGLIAGTILLFVLAYILFQRQEIRA